MTHLNLGSCHSKACDGMPTALSNAKLIFLCVVIAALFAACGPSREEMEAKELLTMSRQAADSVSAYVPDLAADTLNGITHRFIRKAEMKCRVKDVREAGKAIEDLVGRSSGYVASSELRCSELSRSTVRFSKDSALDELRYSTVSHFQLKVPFERLDTVMRRITDMALFADYRHTSAQDVRLRLYSNLLSEKRENAFRNRVEQKTAAITSKQEQAVKTEEALLTHQAIADQTRNSSLALADDILYSTITLEIYQSPTWLREMTAVEKIVEPYAPSFLEQSGEALFQGLTVLKTIALLLMRGWGIIALALSALWFFQRAGKNQKQKAS